MPFGGPLPQITPRLDNSLDLERNWIARFIVFDVVDMLQELEMFCGACSIFRIHCNSPPEARRIQSWNFRFGICTFRADDDTKTTPPPHNNSIIDDTCPVVLFTMKFSGIRSATGTDGSGNTDNMQTASLRDRWQQPSFIMQKLLHQDPSDSVV